MSQYVQKRILLSIPTVLLTSVVVFLMLYLIPGDPASIYVGENQATPERIAQIRHSSVLIGRSTCNTATSSGKRCTAISAVCADQSASRPGNL